jgi:hypothetical protein
VKPIGPLAIAMRHKKIGAVALIFGLALAAGLILLLR